MVAGVPRSGAGHVGLPPEEATMSNTGDNTPPAEDDIEVVEVVTGGVDEHGDVVVDDLVAAVDSEGNILATDETIAVETPDGDVLIDETISVLGDDGELHAVEEDVTIVEADDA
jgi:hypothetical protein